MRGWARDLANDTYYAGRKAHQSGAARESNPHDGHPESAARRLAGFDASAQEAQVWLRAGSPSSRR